MTAPAHDTDEFDVVSFAEGPGATSAAAKEEVATLLDSVVVVPPPASPSSCLCISSLFSCANVVAASLMVLLVALGVTAILAVRFTPAVPIAYIQLYAFAFTVSFLLFWGATCCMHRGARADPPLASSTSEPVHPFATLGPRSVMLLSCLLGAEVLLGGVAAATVPLSALSASKLLLAFASYHFSEGSARPEWWLFPICLHFGFVLALSGATLRDVGLLMVSQLITVVTVAQLRGRAGRAAGAVEEPAWTYVTFAWLCAPPAILFSVLLLVVGVSTGSPEIFPALYLPHKEVGLFVATASLAIAGRLWALADSFRAFGHAELLLSVMLWVLSASNLGAFVVLSLGFMWYAGVSTPRGGTCTEILVRWGIVAMVEIGVAAVVYA